MIPDRDNKVYKIKTLKYKIQWWILLLLAYAKHAIVPSALAQVRVRDGGGLKVGGAVVLQPPPSVRRLHDTDSGVGTLKQGQCHK